MSGEKLYRGFTGPNDSPSFKTQLEPLHTWLTIFGVCGLSSLSLHRLDLSRKCILPSMHLLWCVGMQDGSFANASSSPCTCCGVLAYRMAEVEAHVSNALSKYQPREITTVLYAMAKLHHRCRKCEEVWTLQHMCSLPACST